MTRNIQVHTRTRPRPADKPIIHQDNSKPPLSIEPNGMTINMPQNGSNVAYKFQKCYGETSSQEDIFDGIRPLVEGVFLGQNATVFAYGVTGSGKTHTMQGSVAQPGIIPRVIESIFQHDRSSLTICEVSFSYVEILNDNVYDLLSSQENRQKLQLRDEGNGSVYVNSLLIVPFYSIAEFNYRYRKASRHRKTAATQLNSDSSRSHAILTIYVKTGTEDSIVEFTSGKICLIDLAGSENNNNTGNDKERMKESAHINQSLSHLGTVVEAINKGSPHIRYHALSGNSRGLLICCLAPEPAFARATINTLNFGTRTKRIQASAPTVTRTAARLSLAPARRGTLQPTNTNMLRLNNPNTYRPPTSMKVAHSSTSHAHGAQSAGETDENAVPRTGLQSGVTEDKKGSRSITEEEMKAIAEGVFKKVHGDWEREPESERKEADDVESERSTREREAAVMRELVIGREMEQEQDQEREREKRDREKREREEAEERARQKYEQEKQEKEQAEERLRAKEEEGRELGRCEHLSDPDSLSKFIPSKPIGSQMIVPPQPIRRPIVVDNEAIRRMDTDERRSNYAVYIKEARRYHDENRLEKAEEFYTAAHAHLDSEEHRAPKKRLWERIQALRLSMAGMMTPPAHKTRVKRGVEFIRDIGEDHAMESPLKKSRADPAV